MWLHTIRLFYLYLLCLSDQLDFLESTIFHELCKQKGTLRHIRGTINFESKVSFVTRLNLELNYKHFVPDNHHIFRGNAIKLMNKSKYGRTTKNLTFSVNLDEMTFSLRCLDSCSFIKTFSPFCLGYFHGKLQCLISSCYAGS